MRLRFRTGDQPNDSITEAAVDELSIVSTTPGPNLNFYGRPQIGTSFVMHVAANPGERWSVLTSARSTSLQLASLFGIKKTGVFLLASGTAPANGLSRVTIPIPSTPSLVGTTFHARAIGHGTHALSNVATVTFE
jgi:hypothetical protein